MRGLSSRLGGRRHHGLSGGTRGLSMDSACAHRHAGPMSDEATAQFQSVLDLLARDGPVNEAYVAREAAAAAAAGVPGAAVLAAATAGVGFGCEKDFAAAIDWLALG